MAPPSPKPVKRPSPQLAQMKRTFYFLSRNSLAMVGLAIVLFFVILALSATFYPASSTQMPLDCGTAGNIESNGQYICQGTVICTYFQGSPSPGPNCYAVGTYTESEIAPTINPSDFSHGPSSFLGPLPFGSLTETPSNPYFYNPFDGLVKGSQWSMGIAAGVVASGALIGLLLGAVSGYFGGAVDEFVMRITDIFLSIPALLLTIIIIATIGPQIQAPWHGISVLDQRVGVLMGAFIITWWPGYTRVVRGQVLVTREQKYVEAAKASGARSGRIIRSHIIPNAVYPVLVQLSLDVGSVPLAIGGIIFLGFQIFPGVSQNFPEWGTIAALSVTNLSSELGACAQATCSFPWWQVLFPGATLFLFAISVNFLSDGLRDALDPRLRR
jgi:peptide/nickel transport system permease protein